MLVRLLLCAALLMAGGQYADAASPFDKLAAEINPTVRVEQPAGTSLLCSSLPVVNPACKCPNNQQKLSKVIYRSADASDATDAKPVKGVNVLYCGCNVGLQLDTLSQKCVCPSNQVFLSGGACGCPRQPLDVPDMQLDETGTCICAEEYYATYDTGALVCKPLPVTTTVAPVPDTTTVAPLPDTTTKAPSTEPASTTEAPSTTAAPATTQAPYTGCGYYLATTTDGLTFSGTFSCADQPGGDFAVYLDTSSPLQSLVIGAGDCGQPPTCNVVLYDSATGNTLAYYDYTQPIGDNNPTLNP